MASRTLVLIPSTRLVEQALQAEVGSIPPVLIPVGNKVLLNLIADEFNSLPDMPDIFIATDQGEDKVIDYFSTTQQDYTLSVLHADSRRSLGEVVLTALQQINLHFYDHLVLQFGDTLIGNEIDLSHDGIYYAQVSDPLRWTTFVTDSNRIKNVTEKFTLDRIAEEKAFVGVFVILDIPAFIEALEQTIAGEQATSTELDCFYTGLLAYLDTRDYLLHESTQWSDFGHVDNYFYSTREHINKRFFNKLTLDSKRAILTKTSSDTAKFHNEIAWYTQLPAQLKCYIPQIYEYDTQSDEPYVSMEYYGYPTLSQLFVFAGHHISTWTHAFEAVFRTLSDFHSIHAQLTPAEQQRDIRTMYVDKTRERIALLLAETEWKLILSRELVINGVRYPSVTELMEHLEAMVDSIIGDSHQAFSVIHGDFCAPNILYDPKTRITKILDPRGSFGSQSIYGDWRYDLAKLSHSFLGNYDFIVGDRFRLLWDEASIEYRVLDSEYHSMVRSLFASHLTEYAGDAMPAVKAIEALLFLSMLPLHEDNRQRQLAMLAIGIQQFSEALVNQNLLQNKYIGVRL